MALPHPFLWGAATSSHQIEGHNERNDWWAWESTGAIEKNERSGAATDHWNRFREDLRLAAELGLTSYRFSVEWSRLEPEPGRFDDSAFERYAEIISECEKNGLMPMLTLHHFTSPLWFAVKGGFAWSDAPKTFARFVTEVCNRLGNRIPLWCPLNEPMVLVSGTYLAQLMPPAKFDPKAASKACEGLLRAHVLAYDLIHSKVTNRKGPWAKIPIQVGVAHNMLDVMPYHAWNPIERVFAWALDRFFNRAWLEAVTGQRQIFSVPGLVPRAPQVSEARGRKTVDFIGVNYYTKALVELFPKASNGVSSHKKNVSLPKLPINVCFAKPGEMVSQVDWAVHPEGFFKVLKRAAAYGLPLYVTENGIADANDSIRPTYLTEHIKQVTLAIEAGCDIRGYYYWSLLDNFEWIKGFEPRFGLYEVDYNTFERRMRPSADLYKRIIAANRD